MSIVSLKTRDRQPELMDQPGLDEREHLSALKGLERINRLSGSARILWPAIQYLARDVGREVRVLDLACGGGDVTRSLQKRVKNSGLPIVLHGADLSPTAVEYATKSSAAAGMNELQFFTLDLLQDDLPTDYDVFYSSLFLHHLDEPEAELFLRKQREATRRLVLVNDLRRSRVGYSLAWLGCRLLTRSPIVHVDGPLSVRAAFTIEEIRRLANAAGMQEVTFSRHWPQRFLMRWDREADA